MINHLIAVLASLNLATVAFGYGSGEVLVGTRAADFSAAPAQANMALTEIKATAFTDPLWQKPDLAVGLSAAYDQMRGSLGSGLTSFQGFAFGPEVKASMQFGALTPFATLAYRFGRYQGQGSDNWTGDLGPAFFLFGEQATVEHSKSYASSGTHVAIGTTWSWSEAVALIGEIDLGFERLESDERVFANGRDFTRRSTYFGSRSLLLGARAKI